MPYIGPTGRCYVRDWLNRTLKPRDKASYVQFLEHYAPAVEDRGPMVGMPIWGDLDAPLGEIRWHCKGGKCRIYCSVETGKRIVMLHADIKTWREFSDEDRRRCLRRRADYLSADYVQSDRERAYRERRKGEANGAL